MSELPGQPAQGANLATPDGLVVSSLDDAEMQRRVRQPDLEQRTAHGLRAEVKEELVRRSGVDPYAAERPELFGVVRNHPYRVPGEPFPPDILADLAGGGVHGQLRHPVCAG